MAKRVSAGRITATVLMAAIGAAGALGVQWILAGGETGAASSGRVMPILLGGALGVLSAVVAFMWQDKTGWFRGEDRRSQRR